MITLSLIIPVYKVEQYIEDCLKSIVNQINDENVEIIIIDDGSPDNSIKIIYQFLENLSLDIREKFYVYEQSNQGVSSARNLGIRNSTGQYIAFLDSDDILMPNYFSEIFFVLKENQPDIIQFEYHRFLTNCFDKISGKVKPRGNRLLKKNQELLISIFNENAWYAWLRIYKKDLFKDFLFPVNFNFEDAATIPFIFCLAKEIYFLDKSLYAYRDRKNSITNDVSKDILYKNMISLKYVVDQLSKASQENDLFSIPLAHMLRIYIGVSYKYGGILKAQESWGGVDFKVVRVIDKKQIFHRGDRMFLGLYKYGLISFFIVDFLNYAYTNFNIIKNKLVD